jgi:hypothetical protein
MGRITHLIVSAYAAIPNLDVEDPAKWGIAS